MRPRVQVPPARLVTNIDMKKFVTILILFLAIFGLGIFLGWKINKKSQPAAITSQTILEALRERGFLVTQTNIINQSVKIDSGEQTFWQKLLWGQVVRAQAVVEVNVGVDLKKMTANDVRVAANKITIYMPQAEIFNSRVAGDVNVENKQGILKRLLEKDDGYNKAIAELTKQAELASATTAALEAANKKAQEEILRLVGYLARDKKAEVIVRGAHAD
ncbi:DUF4230 domain-containing protein [Patescibacteria group bacterium]|nr:MAG: DUF4230 domain-containing protein [Patescibacteria group bacterium]